MRSSLHPAPCRGATTRGIGHAATTPLHPYIPTKDVTRARHFYETRLGFTPSELRENGASYRCGASTECFLYETAHAGTSQASQALFVVLDIDHEVAELQSGGMPLEHVDIPGAQIDDDIVTAGGARAAWFKDSEGNIVAVVQPL
ncbi:MAG: VOC family protein [Pseudoxanthomonas sp.]